MEVDETVDESGMEVFHVRILNKVRLKPQRFFFFLLFFEISFLKGNDEVVICFSRSVKLEKFKVTKNSTLFSVSQIAAICEGGIIPGSVYEMY